MSPLDFDALSTGALRPGPAEADFAECAREPIARLGLVQPQGCLLLLSADAGQVLAASANAAQHTGHEASLLPGQRTEALLPAWLCRALAALPPDLPGQVLLHAAQPDPVTDPWHADELVAHRTTEGIVLERVHSPTGPADTAAQSGLAALREALAQDAGNLFRAARTLSAAVAGISGYDRVMVYRFHADWSGEVIAEDCRPDLVPYLGLRYPASDIPEQARALYRRSRVRVVADITDLPVAMLPQGATPDLGAATLRALSPIHIAYLANMGVRATLVASIMVQGALWGLVACHHHEPRLPSHALRETVADMAAAMARPVRQNRRHAALAVQARARAASRWLGSLSTVPEKLLLDLLVGPESLAPRCGADGVAWVRGREVVAVGATPPLDWLRALPARHAGQRRKGLLESIRLGQEEPPGAVAPATGFLAASLPDGSALVLFRREYVHEVHWGGEPMKAVRRGPTGRLMPRESFALWHQTVRGTCLPWGDEERGILALAAHHLAAVAIPPEIATGFAALGTAESLAVRCLPELLLPHLAAAVTEGAAADAPTVLVSDALLRLMGADGPDLVGRPWHQVAARLHLGGAFPRPGVLDEVMDAWSPRGGLLHLRVRREPLLQLAGRHADRLGHWLVHVLDETHAHRVTAALQAASRRAEQANQARIAIMRNLNHELRTPLNAILGFSELIARVGPGADEAETVRGFTAEIQRAGQHLLQVVDGMLDLARIEAGGLQPDRVRFDLAACLRDCCAMCAPEFDRKAIELRCVQPGRPIMVQGDVRMIRQVLINLLANAAKFTPANGAVTCRLEARHGEAEIRVTDNGPGIPIDQQRRIFAPMVQGDAAVTRQQGGLGLGLFIGRAFMEVHGGRLDVQSRPGMGATFLAVLPLAETG